MGKALFANNIKTPFVSLNAGDTTLAVNDDSGFPILSGTDFFYLTLFNLNGSVEENIEIVKVTAKVTTNVYTVVRGQDGTADIAHSSLLDNYAGLRLTAGIADRFVQSDTGFINNDNWSGADLTIANGGTGASTQQAAINALAGATTSGLYLRGNGTNVVMSAIQASDVPTLNQNTTGTASNVTGTVAIANGGTGATTQAAALTAICGTAVAGTFARGNGTNVVMAAIQASDVPTLNQNTTGTASNVTGTVAIANGGTGRTNATEAFDALAPTTTLGDIIYRNDNDNVRLAGNTTTTKQFLSQTGTGTVSAAPAWAALVNGDLPTALIGKTYNGLTLTAAATGFTIAGGTTSKTLTVSNTLTLAGTDSSTLNIGAGGTLGSAAFTASTAYEPAFATLSNTKGGTGQNSSAWTGIPKVVSGTWSVATAGTDYQLPIGTISGLVKGNGANALTAAVAGTDYLAPSAIGTTVQAYDAQLADVAGLTPTDNGVIIGNGTNFVVETGATLRTSLGLAIGTDVQAYSANLASFADKTAPTGGVVGTTDTQTLTNKTLTNPKFDQNLSFTGTGNRITGDFSNATIANRVMFQTSTANGQTEIGAITNGTGSTSSVSVYNSSDANNASVTRLGCTSTDSRLAAAISGTGTYLPITFYTGGSERMRIDTSGNVGIGTASPSFKLDVNGNVRIIGNRINQANTGGIDFEIGVGAGTGDTTLWGFYAPASRGIALSSGGSERLRITSGGDILALNSSGLGYGSGSGGTVTQATSKSTSVTLNTPTGIITMNNAALAPGASVTFIFNNSIMTSGVDTFTLSPVANANYRVEYYAASTQSIGIRVTNITGGSLSEALQIAFSLHKGATS